MESTSIDLDPYERIEMRQVVALNIARYLMAHLIAETDYESSFTFELSDFSSKYIPLIIDLIKTFDRQGLRIEPKHVINQIPDDSIMPWQIRHLLLCGPKYDIVNTYRYGTIAHGPNLWSGKIFFEEVSKTGKIVKHCRARVFRY